MIGRHALLRRRLAVPAVIVVGADGFISTAPTPAQDEVVLKGLTNRDRGPTLPSADEDQQQVP